jgi:hypothetical protein
MMLKTWAGSDRRTIPGVPTASWFRSVQGTQHADKLTREQKRGALRAISLIKEKRCSKIKGDTVVGGRPKRALYTKEEKKTQ